MISLPSGKNMLQVTTTVVDVTLTMSWPGREAWFGQRLQLSYKSATYNKEAHLGRKYSSGTLCWPRVHGTFGEAY